MNNIFNFPNQNDLSSNNTNSTTSVAMLLRFLKENAFNFIMSTSLALSYSPIHLNNTILLYINFLQETSFMEETIEPLNIYSINSP
jgi:hypothetical protein